jgi:hypothetical protein
MRKKRSDRVTWAVVTLGIGGILVGLLCRQIHQSQLDHALIAAIQRSDASTVVALLNRGADTNACEPPAAPPSLWRYLLRTLHGHSLSPRVTSTALLVACRPRDPYLRLGGFQSSAEIGEHVAILRALLERGAGVDVRDPEGSTPLILLARFGDYEGIKLLLERRADIDARDPSGSTPLEYAVTSNGGEKRQTIHMLLEYHADVNTRDNCGISPLAYAKAFAACTDPPAAEYVDIANMLWQAGARM